MASIKSNSQEVSTAMCYKNKLLASYKQDNSVHLYSLSALPYCHLNSLKTSGPTVSFDWGFKKDLILACGPAGVQVFRVLEKDK